MKKILTALLVALCISFIDLPNVQAQGPFVVQNILNTQKTRKLKTFATYDDAYNFVSKKARKYNNLGIYYNDDLYYIENGIIAFNNMDYTVNTNFRRVDNGGNAYTNASYGRDAAFLEYDNENSDVSFMLSGIRGKIDKSEVTIIPIELAQNVSSFEVNDKSLMHNVQTTVPSLTYGSSFSIDKAPYYLKNNKLYYSYDSHYFYDNFAKMIYDYRLNTNKEAINANNPYYNYYQFLPHRSTSKYSQKDLETYFKDTLKINAPLTKLINIGSSIHSIYTQSMLPAALPAFLQYQNEFGSNALLMLGLSINESAYGRSNLTFTRNNAFGHAAYDSDVEASASRYQSIGNSVYSHALNYISTSYAQPNSMNYHGSFLGNKAQGMSVSYASDPYWGEKAAHYAYKIDEANGFKDHNVYSVGIGKNKTIEIFSSANPNSTTIQSIENGLDFPFILLEQINTKNGKFYRIQSEGALSSDKIQEESGLYSFGQSFAYVKADDIETIFGKKKISSKNYLEISFDGNGGVFYPDRQIVKQQVEAKIEPTCTPPTKTNALFVGWDKEIKPATTNTTYFAQYSDVQSIELSELPQVNYQLNETLNVEQGIIKVLLQNGSSQEVNLNTEMISNFSTTNVGKIPITVSYAGTTCTFEIVVEDTLPNKQSELVKLLDSSIKNYGELENVNEEGLIQLDQLKRNYFNLDQDGFSSNQIRSLDKLLVANSPNKAQVIISDDSLDLQVSGIQSSLALAKSNWFFNIPNTVKISLSKRIDRDCQELIQPIATILDRKIEEVFTISGTHNGSGFHPQKRLLFSIDKTKKNNNLRYYVVKVENDLAQLMPTTQSNNRIMFESDTLGSFALLSSEDSGIAPIDDLKETHTIDSNGTDHIRIFVLYPLLLLVIFVFIAVIGIMIRRRFLKSKKNSLN